MRRLLPCLLTLLVTATAVADEPLRFTITRDAQKFAEPYTGRVYVLMSSTRYREPRFGPPWFGTDPFIAVDVEDWKADEAITIDDSNAITYPVPLAEIPEAHYGMQAVMRLNLDAPRLAADGNPFSLEHKDILSGATGGEVTLHIRSARHRAFAGSKGRVQRVAVRSALLSGFHGREITMHASVIKPPGYADQPDRHWPVEYWIGGFGSDHTVHKGWLNMWDATPRSEDIARVVLDPRCFGGHHVFADSANNGPRGRALVEELIPYLEEQFRFVPKRHARFLSGHSSGGWSSLWLQVSYPDTFGGTWSIAPDPVDFSSFQNADIYAENANEYFAPDGTPLALAHRYGQPLGLAKDFDAMEIVYGDGGQLRSFEWVFSPRGPDGRPMRLWDRATGAIDPEVAEAWKKYDIRMILEENWSTLGPKLENTINVFCGDQDTFYLSAAVVKLKEAMKRLDARAVVEIHPGKDHGSIASMDLKERVRHEQLALFDRREREERKRDE